MLHLSSYEMPPLHAYVYTIKETIFIDLLAQISQNDPIFALWPTMIQKRTLSGSSQCIILCLQFIQFLYVGYIFKLYLTLRDKLKKHVCSDP